MIRSPSLVAGILVALVVPLAAHAQKLDPVEVTHEDDLAIGPLKMTIDLRPSSGAKAEPKEATVLFLTKTKLVTREKDGHVTFRDGQYVPRVSGPGPKDKWDWNEKTKQYEGAPLPPTPIRLSADRQDKKQLAGYLAVRAEFLYLELDNAMARRETARIQHIARYAGSIKEFARRENLGTEVVSLFDLQVHAETTEKLLKQLSAEFESLQKQKINDEKNLAVVRRSFEARASVGLLRMLAGGTVYSAAGNTETEDLGFTVALSGLGDLGQAAARRDLDERMLKEATGLYEDKAIAKINDIRAAMRANQAKLVERPKGVWDKLNVQEDTVRRLDSLSGTLLEKKDLTAALVVLEARTRYLAEKGFKSPQLVCLVNNLKASDEGRKPADAADRALRSEKIFKLAQNTIDAVKLVPDDPVFLTDRLQVLAAGAKLVHAAVSFAQEPKSNTPLSEAWDPRADYGARALAVARTPEGTLADPDGIARALRATLLFERGLHREALEAGRKLEDHASLDPTYLVNVARFYAKTGNPKEAATVLTKAYKSGFRGVRAAEADPDLKPMWEFLQRTKADLWKFRETPELEAFLDPNPLSIGKSFPSYSLEIRNKTSYPLINVKVKYFGKFKQNFKAVEASSQELTIDYLGPVGSASDTFFWPDAFKSAGTHDSSILRATMDRKGAGGKAIQGNVVVKASDRSFFRPYWWFYRPYWYDQY